MRTVYEIHDNNSMVASVGWEIRSSADDWAAWRDARYPDEAPHTVVERQEAGPEDTDQLLRLLALVGDLRVMLAEVIKTDGLGFVEESLTDLLARHGFGGES